MSPMILEFCRFLRRGSAAVVLGLACGAVSGQVAAAPLVLNEGGMVREFDLALDEVAVRRGERRELRVVAARRREELLDKARALGRLEADPGVGVEPVLYERGVRHSGWTRRYVTRKLLVRVVPGAEVAEVLADAGLQMEGAPGYAPGWVIVLADTPADALGGLERLRGHAQVASAELMLARWRMPRLVPNDPLFSQQWNLRNTAQGGATPGVDIHVTPVWEIFRGTGVTIGIIDDGLQSTHPDLQVNYRAAQSYDFNGGDADPTPGNLTTDAHGTACAGVAAARGNNGIGCCGVAYEAGVAGIRLIAAANTDQQEADAFSLYQDAIHVKSNSWGAPDTGEAVEGPGPLAAAALANGTATGRSGRGTIYVFAGGNGNDFNDNSNYDGYANSIHTIAVGAVNDYGFQSYYSEPGANLHVCAPSNGGLHNQGIVATDLIGGGDNTTSTTDDLTDRDYTKWFGGTSAAAPAVAGICALMLQANSQLGWRDVQEILLRSARQVHHADSDWSVNAAGLHFNHKYGAGLVDAQAAVTMAQGWVNLGPLVSSQVTATGLPTGIPDNSATGISKTFNVANSNLRVEHVTVTVNINHSRRGDLEVTLTSPSGMVSRLAEQHGDPGVNLANWTFSSVRHWGESAAGNWTVRICDRMPGASGTLTAASLTVHGSTVAAARVVPAGLALVTEGNLPANSAADPGERVSYRLGLKNSGAAASGDLTATLLNLGGVTNAGPAQAYGSLASGGAVTNRTFSFTAGGACGTATRLVFRLDGGGGLLGYATTQLPLGVAATVTQSGGAVTIRDDNTANPFPSTLNLSGLSGRVHGIRATLNGFSHSSPSDVAVFLGGPDDLNVALFTDAATTAVTSRNLTFDDNASVYFPSAGAANTGSYRPWDASYFTSGSSLGFDAEPAEDERGFTLGEFNGLKPNGTWRLYAQDYVASDSGSITGWSVAVTTVDCTDNVYLTTSAPGVAENAGPVVVSVTRTGGREGVASVQYATSPGTAAAGGDYTHVAGMLNFAAGETVKTFSVPLLDNAIAEGDETFNVMLQYPGGNTSLGSPVSGTVTIVDNDRSDIESWRWNHFGSIANTGDSADGADPDHDGLVNLLEFAFGLDPGRSSAGQLPQVTRSGGNLTVSFARPAGVSGITYGAEWSDSLQAGTWSAIPDTQLGSTHTFSIATTGRPRMFLRLKVSRP